MREYEHGTHHFDAFIELLHSCRDGAMKPLAELHYQSVFTPQHLPQKRAHHAAPTPKAWYFARFHLSCTNTLLLGQTLYKYAAYGLSQRRERELNRPKSNIFAHESPTY